MEIAAADLTCILHGDRGGKTLSARCAAAVQNAISRLRRSGRYGEPGGGILHVDQSLQISFQVFRASRAGDRKAVRLQRMRRRMYAFLFQRGGGLFRRTAQSVCLQRRLRRLVIALQQSLDFFCPDVLFQQRYQRLRMAVPHGKRLRLRQFVLLSRKRTEHSVDQPGSLSVCIFLSLLDRFVHGGGSGYAIQIQDLICAEAQNVCNNRLQLGHFSVQAGVQIPIQQHAVLQNAVDEPARQRGVAAIQLVPFDIAFQHAVRPAVLSTAGDQCGQGRRSGAHKLLLQIRIGCPRK